MNGYLLDTNAASELIRHPRGVVAQRRILAGGARVATSVIVAAELQYGVRKRGSDRLRHQLQQVLAELAVLDLASPADSIYAELRADLERRGVPIGGNDLWIASHALALDRTLVTANTREFSRVPGLRIENWVEG